MVIHHHHQGVGNQPANDAKAQQEKHMVFFILPLCVKHKGKNNNDGNQQGNVDCQHKGIIHITSTHFLRR